MSGNNNNQKDAAEIEMAETFPLRHEGDRVGREPMARSMGLTLHSK